MNPLTSSKAALGVLRPFLSNAQMGLLLDACKGDEGRFFEQKLVDLAALIEAMPVTYEQDEQGDQARVYLHYFLAGSHWYITEKDIDGGVRQAFGFAILNGCRADAELGYISIEELTAAAAEMDLYFSTCSLATVRQQLT